MADDELNPSARRKQQRRDTGQTRTRKPEPRAGETDREFAARLAAWREVDRAYMRAYDKQRRATDPVYAEAQRAQARAWKAKNKERVREYRARYGRENADQERASNKAWRAKNPDRIAEYQARWQASPKRRAAWERWYSENRESTFARRMQRYYTDPDYRLLTCLRNSLNQALRLHGDGRKTYATRDLIGCTIEELVAHLERQFTKGMTWENYGRVWVIDHIRPCASFSLEDPEEQRACFNFLNLRPLCRKKNQTKSAKLELLL